MSSSAPAPAVRKEEEIEEVMEFLRYSVKPSIDFAGTILFKFRGNDGQPSSAYAVHVGENRGMSCFVC